MTTFYRNSNISEIVVKNRELFISPKEFKANNDSNISSGNWSFWFNKPIVWNPIYTEALVEAEFIPEAQGVMGFSVTDIDYSEDGKTTYHGNVDEFVTSKEIKINRLWINHHYIENEKTNKSDYVKCHFTNKLFYDGEEIDWNVKEDIITASKEAVDKFNILTLSDDTKEIETVSLRSFIEYK